MNGELKWVPETDSEFGVKSCKRKWIRNLFLKKEDSKGIREIDSEFEVNSWKR